MAVWFARHYLGFSRVALAQIWNDVIYVAMQDLTRFPGSPKDPLLRLNREHGSIRIEDLGRRTLQSRTLSTSAMMEKSWSI